MEKLPILWKSNYSYWLQLIYTKYVHPCRISVLCYFWQLKPHSFSCREEKEIIITPHQKKNLCFMNSGDDSVSTFRSTWHAGQSWGQSFFSFFFKKKRILQAVYICVREKHHSCPFYFLLLRQRTASADVKFLHQKELTKLMNSLFLLHLLP